MNEKILLTHSDMDGIGCELVLGYKHTIPLVINSNYNDIIENLKNIDEKITIHSSIVYITDLNFNEAAFIELIRLAMNATHVKFIYIDHHEYKDKSYELLNKIQKLPNVYVKHDISKCATALCYDLIKSSTEYNSNLDKLVKFINAYDIYLEDEPEFKVGFMLNSVFWAIKASSFKFNIKNNDYKIPKNFLEINKELNDKKNKKFKQYEKNGLIIKDDDNKIFLAFSDDYKSFYTHDYPDYNVYVLPYVSKNNISIRVKHLSNEIADKLKDEILEFVGTYPKLISVGGHRFAFGISIDQTASKDEVLLLIRGIIEISEKYKD